MRSNRISNAKDDKKIFRGVEEHILIAAASGLIVFFMCVFFAKTAFSTSLAEETNSIEVFEEKMDIPEGESFSFEMEEDPIMELDPENAPPQSLDENPPLEGENPPLEGENPPLPPVLFDEIRWEGLDQDINADNILSDNHVL